MDRLGGGNVRLSVALELTATLVLNGERELVKRNDYWPALVNWTLVRMRE